MAQRLNLRRLPAVILPSCAAEARSAAVSDLHKCHKLFIAHNQIDLPDFCRKISGDEFESSVNEKLLCQAFPVLAGAASLRLLKWQTRYQRSGPERIWEPSKVANFNARSTDPFCRAAQQAGFSLNDPIVGGGCLLPMQRQGYGILAQRPESRQSAACIEGAASRASPQT